MSGQRNWQRGAKVRRPAKATANQMRLWRDLAAELRLPPPPSGALFVEACRNIDRLLRLKGRPVK